MIPAPLPYPDELLSSALIRCCRWFNLSFKLFAREVLRLPNARSNFFSIWPLSNIAHLYGISPADLLWDHTPFPYATAYCPTTTYALASRAALTGGTGMPQLLATMQNASVGTLRRRVCLKCVQEDLARYGESYWHRDINLPGVLFCPRHGCGVSFTTVPTTGVLKTIYTLPIECDTDVGVELPRAAALLELSRRSSLLLTRARTPGIQRSWRSYRALAIQNGWLTGDRTLSEKALSDAVHRQFPRDIVVRAGLSGETAGRSLALAMRPGAFFNMSPMKHLILEIVLSAPASSPGCLDYVSSGPGGTSSSALDAFYAPRARAELRSALREQERLTTAEFLRRSGALGAYRHRKAELPRLRQVVLEFRGSPASVKRLRPGSSLFHSHPCELVERTKRSQTEA